MLCSLTFAPTHSGSAQLNISLPNGGQVYLSKFAKAGEPGHAHCELEVEDSDFKEQAAHFASYGLLLEPVPVKVAPKPTKGDDK